MPKICLMCGASFPDATTFCPTDGSALRAAVQGDDLIGELVAERYLITDLLSQGGMGEVYLASDVRLPQQFAIKVLKQQKSPDPSLIARFRQEAEAVCRINHDRVARVFDFGFMADERAYIVMEYVAGKTLRKLVEERGALDPVEAAKITLMAAEGIDAAHRLGIVHRDLKPENIMILDDPGGGTRVKVLDFGIAKLQNAEADRGYTQPGFVIGTPAWMSPEQLLGEPLDARSDVYSLALIAFVLLTGEHAFTGVSEQAEMMARITVPPRTLTEIRPQQQWPADLLRLFDRTLSKNPSDRPATASQFATAMLNAVHGDARIAASAANSPVASPHASPNASLNHSASATPISSSSAVRAPAAPRRNTAMLSAIGAVAVVVIAGVIWQQGRPESASDRVSPDGSAPDSTAIRPPIAAPAALDSAAVGAQPPDSTTSTIRPPTVSPSTAGTGTPAANSNRATPAPVADRNAERNASGLPPAEAKPPATSSGGTTNAELDRIMSEADSDGSPKKARETIIQLDVLRGRLRNPADQAWAEIYLGLAHLTLGDKEKACAAFERGGSLAGTSKAAKSASEDNRLMAGCRP